MPTNLRGKLRMKSEYQHLKLFKQHALPVHIFRLPGIYGPGRSIFERLQSDKKIQIIDVREDTERDHAHIKGTIHMKLSEIAKRYTELDKKKNIFVMCHTGTRSQAVCKWLKAQGYNHCVNVLGGIDAWAALIDRNIRRY